MGPPKKPPVKAKPLAKNVKKAPKLLEDSDDEDAMELQLDESEDPITKAPIVAQKRTARAAATKKVNYVVDKDSESASEEEEEEGEDAEEEELYESDDDE